MYSEIGLKSECSSVEEEEGELEGEQVLVRPHDGGQDGDTSEIRQRYIYILKKWDVGCNARV